MKIINVDENIQEVNDEGYFYEDIINEDEGFVSEGPWIESPNEYSSVKPLNAEPETIYIQSGKLIINRQTTILLNVFLFILFQIIMM